MTARMQTMSAERRDRDIIGTGSRDSEAALRF
jgi:hypothetical protein